MKKIRIKGDIIDFKVIKRLFTYVRPYRATFFLLIFLTLLLGVLAPLRPLIIGITIDRFIAPGNYSGLVKMIIVLIVILAVQGIVQFYHTYLSGWIGQYIIRDIRIRLYQHLLNLKLKFFDRTPIGVLVTRNISDVETLAEVFSNGLASLAGEMLQLVFILAVMFWLNWKLTLISLSTLPLLIIATYIFKEKIKVAFDQVRNAVARLNAFVQEHITGMSVVQIFNHEKQSYRQFMEINRGHRQAHIRSVLYYSVYFPASEVIQALGIGLVVWFGAKGIMEGITTFGELTAFIMYINMFFRPIRQIADRFNTLQMGIVSSTRIFRLLDHESRIQDEGKFKPERLRGDVSFQNVWFAYNNEEYVLKDISFEVKKGQTLALVGATGAGKSSVINVLNRFYEINKGKILIDDRDIRTYDLRSLREHIGVVLQDVFLFSGTIEENITLGNPEISRTKIYETADMLGALHFIEKLPGKLNYNVRERGAVLSTGQRQLVSFIRAMVYDPGILILDEATSSVDSETEELIRKAILQMMTGRTSIIIAHRLSTIQEADKILVLRHGEIVETGKHAQLLRSQGYYAQLYRMQYREVVRS